MKTGEQEFDKLCNENWNALLKMFHAIQGKPEETKRQYVSLKELTKTKTLSPRQSEGITDRCDNAINGVYGKTKKPEDYSQQHNFSSNGKQ